MKNITLTKFHWAVLAALTIASLASFSNVLPAVLPLIMKEFQLTYIEAGLLISMSRCPAIFLPIFIGILADRYGGRRMVAISLSLSILSCFAISNSSAYILLLFSLLVLAAGYQIQIISSSFMISNIFPPKELGKAIGFFNAGTIAIIGIAPVISWIGTIHGWRECFYIGAVLGIMALGIFLLVARKEPLCASKCIKEQRGGEGALQSVLSNFELWKIGICRLLEIVATTAFQSWTPTFFTESRRISLVLATFLPSLFMITVAILSPFIGSISDRWKKRKLLLVIALIGWAIMLAVLPLAPTYEIMLLIVILGGVVATPIPTMSTTIIPEITGPSHAGLGFGIHGICVGIGGLIAPILIGYVRTVTSDIFVSYLCAALFNAAAAIVALTLKSK